MFKVVIIEDEAPSRRKLNRFIEQLDDTVMVVAELSTVEEAIAFLQEKNNEIDLIFSDIELLDGNAFEIYEQVAIQCPVIFATAYNDFWMSAFESNGIEYLLKPFSQERFNKAWKKFLLLKTSPDTDVVLIEQLRNLINTQTKSGSKEYKRRFLINHSKGAYFLEIADIVYFTASEGLIYGLDKTGKKHILSITTLKELEEILDPVTFFRINRGEVVNKRFIQRIERYTKNTIGIQVGANIPLLVTSQAMTASFRNWLEE